MKTLLCNRGSMAYVDPKTMEINVLASDRNSTDDVFLLDEDCHIKAYCNTNDGKVKIEEYDAKAGDILVRFWERQFPHRYILVKSKEWKENIEAYRASEQKAKEEWAAKQAAGNTPDPECDAFQKD